MSAALAVHAMDPAGEEAALWESYVAAHPDSSCYHTLAWSRVLVRSFGYRAWHLLARDAQGAVRGCLPLFLVSSPLSRRLVAVPFRDRGGVLWDTPEAFDALVREAARLAGEQHAGFVELKTLVDYPAQSLPAHALTERRYWVHSALDLRGLDPDGLLHRVGGKTRNMLRQAERAGLAFEAADDALRAWYRLHLATQKNLGLPPFAESFFRNVLESLGPSAARVFVVRRGSEDLAATLVLIHGKTATYAYSGSAPEGRVHRPNDFMIHRLVLWLLEHGFETFDMGSDAPSQTSLLFFKAKWGARQAAIPTYTLGDAPDWVADSSSPRYAALRRGFRYLPTAALRVVGGLTAKYFG